MRTAGEKKWNWREIFEKWDSGCGNNETGGGDVTGRRGTDHLVGFGLNLPERSSLVPDWFSKIRIPDVLTLTLG